MSEVIPYNYDNFQSLLKEVKELRKLVIDQGKRLEKFEKKAEPKSEE